MNGLLGFGDKLYQAFLVEDRWRLYLDGLGVTLGITLGAICISTVLGMVLCLMKMSRHRILRWPAQAYIDIIRGIPVVVQLLIMYNVVLLNVTDNKMVVAVIAFGLNSSAYMAEIYRSGINAVDPGQMEAGRSLGLSKVQTMWSVIFPQALKNCLPTYTSEFIVLVKETAVVGYDNSTYARLCEPELTSVDNKPEQVALLCVQLLQSRIEHGEDYSSVTLQPELVQRQSS